MHEIIAEKLKKIETDFDVLVLYACESGSRAWGFPSKDSDYDVRFIYVHKPAWYLSIDEHRDVIELPINDLLDISGWELTKALRLFRKSNPPLVEWLSSSIVYDEAYGLANEMRELISEVYTPKSCIFHYLSMARGNYREFLQADQVKIKKYFYVLRPILACKWIVAHGSNPPLVFAELLDAIVPAGELKETIESLLERKMRGDEFDLEPRIDCINQFIEAELTELSVLANKMISTQTDPTERLNTLFRKTLTEVWQDSV